MVRWSWRVALDHLRPPQVVVVEGGGPPLPPCTFEPRPRQGILYMGILLALVAHGVEVLEQQLGEWGGGLVVLGTLNSGFPGGGGGRPGGGPSPP